MRPPYWERDGVTLYHGDCLGVLAALEPDSVDACVTDPPYELAFMGHRWDASGVAFQVDTWVQVLRVLKPGGHLVALGGTRTHHRLWCALEDAGFEVRDTLLWLHGQGFPKSLNVSKAIDKAAGAERETVGTYELPDVAEGRRAKPWGLREDWATDAGFITGQRSRNITASATEASRRWEGWGTGLKPAWEPIVLARKPLVGTIAANVQEYGTGALNIDGCRVYWDEAGARRDRVRRLRPRTDIRGGEFHAGGGHAGGYEGEAESPAGRWPANVALSCTCEETQEGRVHTDPDCPAAMLDAQSGERKSGTRTRRTPRSQPSAGWRMKGGISSASSGGASRFFYCPKASRRERGNGNSHPTVKPLALMRWLVRLVMPPNGLALDPFLGSGTTALASRAEGVRCIGIDKDESYCQIAVKRLEGE